MKADSKENSRKVSELDIKQTFDSQKVSKK